MELSKTMKHIIAQPIEEPVTKEGTVFERDVAGIEGIQVRVKSHDAPGEPVGTYVAWLDYPNLGQGFKKLLQNGETVKAKIKMINQRWEVMSFEVVSVEGVFTGKKSTKEEFDFEQGNY